MDNKQAREPSLLRKVEVGLYTILGVLMTICMFGNAVMRYVFDSSLVWSEETIRIFFVWAMFIAITGGFVRNEHIGFDSLAKIPGLPNLLYRLTYGSCLVVVGGLLAYYGAKFTLMTGDVPLAATNLPTSLFMWPGVVAGAVWVVVGARRIAGIFVGGSEGRSA